MLCSIPWGRLLLELSENDLAHHWSSFVFEVKQKWKQIIAARVRSKERIRETLELDVANAREMFWKYYLSFLDGEYEKYPYTSVYF